MKNSLTWIWEKDGKEIESEVEFTITIEPAMYEHGGSGGEPGGTYIEVTSIIIDGMPDSEYEKIENHISENLNDNLREFYA